MTYLACTLISEGSSDVALIPMLLWLLAQHEALPVRPMERYDPAIYRHSPKALRERIDHAVENFPCDILFVHRDGDGVGLERREEEIFSELNSSRTGSTGVPLTVLVIPIRMMEAWLLFNERSIRSASGCPRGKSDLDLPGLAECERIADPKARLHSSLLAATEKTGRRLKRFNVHSAVHRVAELIGDYSPLRVLPAFQRFESNLASALAKFKKSGTATARN